MRNEARIWIYQSPRKLNPDEVSFIKDASVPFLKEWTSHKMSMDASLEILHERFVVLAVDESTAPASGCGIDDSVRFIKMLSGKLGVDLTDRTTVYYKIGEEINAAKLEGIRGTIKPDTLVFNNLIDSYGQLKNQWLAPASSCWVSRFL